MFKNCPSATKTVLSLSLKRSSTLTVKQSTITHCTDCRLERPSFGRVYAESREIPTVSTMALTRQSRFGVMRVNCGMARPFECVLIIQDQHPRISIQGSVAVDSEQVPTQHHKRVIRSRNPGGVREPGFWPSSPRDGFFHYAGQTAYQDHLSESLSANQLAEGEKRTTELHEKHGSKSST